MLMYCIGILTSCFASRIRIMYLLMYNKFFFPVAAPSFSTVNNGNSVYKDVKRPVAWIKYSKV